MIWATVSSRSSFNWLFRDSSSLPAKNISIWFYITIWWCTRVESSLGLLKRMFAVTSMFSWQNSVSLCPASFCTLRPNLPIILSTSWLSTLTFHPLWWKEHLFFMLMLEDAVGIHSTGQLRLLWRQWLGHWLGLAVMLNGLSWKQTSIILLFLSLHPSIAFQTLVDSEGYSTSSKVFLSMVVDIMIIWIKFSHPINFSSPIPKMLMFNLPIFLLEHIQFTLIHGPNHPSSYVILFFRAMDYTLTTRHIHSWASFPLWPSCFILTGAIGKCPLLFSSSNIGHLLTWGALVLVSCFFTFLNCSWGSPGKNTGVGCHFFLPWTMSCQNSSLWPVCLGWPCTAWIIASLS